MNNIGKRFRWGRFTAPHQHHSIIVPIDHGLTIGPIKGINTIDEISKWIHHEAINGIVAHKGIASKLINAGLLRGKGLIVHLNGMTSLATNATRKEMLTQMEEAVAIGADAVSIELVFDGVCDEFNMKLLGTVTERANQYGVPILTMVKDLHPHKNEVEKCNGIRQVIRTMTELGASAVKIPRPNNIEEVSPILDGLCHDIDIFFAGAQKTKDHIILQMAETALRHGAKGLCMGRNVFQHEHPAVFLDKLQTILNFKTTNDHGPATSYAQPEIAGLG